MTDETISNVPILILGNKIDRTDAISEEKLREIFGLYGQTTGKVRKSLKGGVKRILTTLKHGCFSFFVFLRQGLFSVNVLSGHIL